MTKFDRMVARGDSAVAYAKNGELKPLTALTREELIANLVQSFDDDEAVSDAISNLMDAGNGSICAWSTPRPAKRK